MYDVYTHINNTHIRAYRVGLRTFRAGLTVVPVVPWEGPHRQPPSPDQLPIFYQAVLTSKRCENVHKPQFRVGLQVTFGLNDRRIPIQYSTWSAKGFGEAIDRAINSSRGEATGH